MEAGRFDAISRNLARPASRRRLLGGGIGGAFATFCARIGRGHAQICAALGGTCAADADCCDAASCCGGVCSAPAGFLGDPANCGVCGHVCDPGFECANGSCFPEPCPAHLEACPEGCCPPLSGCDLCQPEGEICIADQCFPIIVSEDQATCATADRDGVITRVVAAASSDGDLTLGARATAQRNGAVYGGDARVHLSLAVSEGPTSQVRIEAVSARDRGLILVAEYGPAFAGVRTLTARSEPGEDPALDADNRGAGVTPALTVDPAFAAAAADLDTALSGDLGACFAADAEASPVAGTPVSDGEGACATCQDACGAALAACFPPAGAACLSDPSACVAAIVACTDAYWDCVDGCPGGGGC
jgi:hypothetical protein